MITISLTQKTPEWLEHRRTHRNASDTPSVTGHSPYKSRTKFMGEWVTGIVEEVDEPTQRRFDGGNRAEELARPLMAQIIGEDLSPVVGVDEVWSASFDGLNFDETIAAEHKALNDTLRAVTCAAELPIYYREQMEHQLMVCGGVKCLFMASKWNDDDTLAEEIHFWYEPDMNLRAQIIAAWDQFLKDAETHKPQEYIPAPKADVQIELPALFVHAQGHITDSNMKAYGEALTAKLAEVRAIALVTDQDFANAKAAAALFREQCKKLMLTKEAMLSQTVSIGEAARMMDAWHEDLRQTALKLEKDVEREDLAKKRTMVSETALAYAAHIEALEAETRPIQLNINRPNFAEAIKGKRNYASMQSALNDALAAGKIEADAVAKDIRAKLAWCKETSAGFGFLFNDLAQIIGKTMDDFKLLVTSRITEHKHQESVKQEAERARIQAQEEAKAKAAQEAILAAERAKMEAEVRAKAADEAKAHAEYEAGMMAEQAKIAALQKTLDRGEEIEASRKNAQLKAQEQPFKSGSMPVVTHPFPATGTIVPTVANRPSRSEMLSVLGSTFGGDADTALGWILAEFRGDIEFAAREAA